MGSRAPRKKRRCWRGVAKDKGFPGRPTPTWAATGAENPGPVGVARRRTKASRRGQRQHGRPRAEEKASVLAWRGERQRLSGKANANMGGRRRRKSGPCWRGETKDKGFAGWPTPTWAPARRGKGAGVGVAWRRTKALRGGQRQHGPPPARKTQALLAWRDEGVRLCGEPDANMGARRRRQSGPCWRGSNSG